MVLLVFLAIIWVGVGLYWLKNRSSVGSSRLGSSLSRRPSLGAMLPRQALSTPLGKDLHVRPSRPTEGKQVPHLQAIHQVAAPEPGHSLIQPARQGDPRTIPIRKVTTDQARRRRRIVLLTLFAFAALTLLGAITVGGSFLILLHLAVDALLLGFILLLVQYQREVELDRTRNRPVYAGPRGNLAATGTEGR